MTPGPERGRTLFGELLRQRGQTAEEFSEEAERFAWDHGLNATLGPRHVQRLATGKRADGKPLTSVRPVTRRLLEAMLSVPVDQLLKPFVAEPKVSEKWSEEALELRARIASGRAVDQQTASLLQQKLDLTRVIDRRLGASTLLGELRAQINQMWRLLTDVLDHRTRVSLAEVLADASTLAGWQSLDQGQVREAWEHYDQARSAAQVAESKALEAYACAGQAVVLLDVGDTASAVEMTTHAREVASGKSPALLSAWLSAGHGEALAAHGDRKGSALAFEEASKALPAEPADMEARYLVFDQTHLIRWYGSALARVGDLKAVTVITDVLHRLDPTFARAETALRVDLARVLAANGEREEASAHAERARLLAAQVGSTRQRRRLDSVFG